MADKNLSELNALTLDGLSNDDLLMVWNQQDGTTRRIGVQDMLEQGREFNQGYYGVISTYYDFNGTDKIEQISADVWTPLVAERSPTQILPDESPNPALALPDGTASAPWGALGDGNGLYDATTGRFCMAKTNPGAYGIVRILLRCKPEEDESQLEVKLNFRTNSTYYGNGLDGFDIPSIMLTMTQGADEWYSDEELISFFVGDTLTGDGWDDAGSFDIQVRPSVDAEVQLIATTYMMQY